MMPPGQGILKKPAIWGKTFKDFSRAKILKIKIEYPDHKIRVWGNCGPGNKNSRCYVSQKWKPPFLFNPHGRSVFFELLIFQNLAVGGKSPFRRWKWPRVVNLVKINLIGIEIVQADLDSFGNIACKPEEWWPFCCNDHIWIQSLRFLQGIRQVYFWLASTI